MLQAVDQRSASSAGRRATAIGAGLAPWIVRPVLQRPASVAAHCCKARCPHCRTLLQPNGAVQQRDQGRAEPTQVDFRCTIAADSQQWRIRRRRKSQNFNAKKNKWLRPT
jgi:hypothetical protein